MKMTFQVNGREMTFSKKELTSILEKHFSSETQHNENTEAAKKPIEGIPFEVNPQAIDQNLFKEKRKDKRQEETRQYIVEAFEEMKKNPDKYGKDFKTLMPEKNWGRKTVSELKQMASEIGNHNAGWVEQALEWAQTIANGNGSDAAWEERCNNPDTAKWYRMVIWKNGYVRLVGGSRYDYDSSPASDVSNVDCSNNDGLSSTVPLVVL